MVEQGTAEVVEEGTTTTTEAEGVDAQSFENDVEKLAEYCADFDPDKNENDEMLACATYAELMEQQKSCIVSNCDLGELMAAIHELAGRVGTPLDDPGYELGFEVEQ